MRNFKFLIILLVILVSCSEKQTNKVEVKFSFGYQLQWDNANNKFYEDENYNKLKKMYLNNRQKIIESILDTTSLNIESCLNKNSSLKKGDLSIVLMNSIEHLNFSKIFSGNKFDNFYECNYPIGLFDHIDRNRKSFVEKMKNEEINLK